MARYSRGQVCGVDNCPSRLWKRVDGRNVCQYGHVNEFDIEIDDEDDMQNAGGNMGTSGPDFSRRLVNVAGLTTSQSVRDKVSRLSTEKAATRKYGEDFKKLQARCFQIILAKNTKFLIQQLNLSNDQAKTYISLVMLIWSKLLHSSLNRFLDTKHKAYDIGLLSIINYLAIIQMNLPLYLCDYISLTFHKKFNLERSEYCLPRELRVQIPISQISSFHGHTLLNHLKKISGKFPLKYIRENITSSRLNYYPLLVRTILNLKLPLEIIKLVKNCVDILKIEFDFANKVNKSYIHPELQLMALIAIFTKIYFMNNSEVEYINWYENFNKFTTKSTKSNFLDFKKKLFHNTSFQDLYSWNNDEIDEFIEFYANNVLPNISSSNIASSNESKDRSKLQIVKSLGELLELNIYTDNTTLDVENAIKEYKQQLLELYNKSDVINNHLTSVVSDSFLKETLFKHVLAAYNCSELQLRNAIRSAWEMIQAIATL